MSIQLNSISYSNSLQYTTQSSTLNLLNPIILIQNNKININSTHKKFVELSQAQATLKLQVKQVGTRMHFNKIKNINLKVLFDWLNIGRSNRNNHSCIQRSNTLYSLDR